MKKRDSLLFYSIVFFIIAMPIISIGENLGLYFDSVFPDYAATQVLDSQQYEVKWFVSWPILTQLYHGSLQVLLSAFVIMLTGTTSVVQHRLVNAFIITICFYLADKILEEFTSNVILRRIIIVVYSLMPTMLGFCLTQYYIELPGVVATLLAWLLIIRYEKNESYKTIWGSFLLLGFAVYCYFNFLFLIPGMFIITLIGKNKKTMCNNFIMAVSGVLPGISLYIFGYIKMYLNINNALNLFSIVIILGITLIISIEILFYKLMLADKQKYIFCFLSLMMISFFIFAFFLRDTLVDVTSGLNVMGNSASLTRRIKLLFDNLYYSVSGVSGEYLMLGYQVTKWSKIFLIFFSVITLIYFLLICINKKLCKKTQGWKYLLVIFIYLCCCIPLITRMQTQHFVPICFLIIVLTVIECIEIANNLGSINCKYIYVGKTVLTMCVVVLAFSCIYNRYKLVDEIMETGGHGYYTKQINRLADEALENLQNGKKEIYIFPEWGFMSGFNYITNNNVAFSTDASVESIERYMSEGYDVEIVFWNKQNKEELDSYINEFGALENSIVNLCEYVGNNNYTEFYKIDINRIDTFVN